MKIKLVLSLLTLLLWSSSYAQISFGNPIPNDPFYSYGSPRDMAIMGNDLYYFHIKNEGTSFSRLHVDKYEQSNSTWYRIDSTQIIPDLDTLQVHVKNNVAYCMTSADPFAGGSEFRLFKYALNSNQIQVAFSSMPIYQTSPFNLLEMNWVYDLGTGTDEHYVLYNSGPSNISFLKYGPTLAQPQMLDVTTVINPIISAYNGSLLQLYSDNSNVFIYAKKNPSGVASRMVIAKSAIVGGSFAYSANGSDGIITYGPTVTTPDVLNLSGIVHGDKTTSSGYLVVDATVNTAEYNIDMMSASFTLTAENFSPINTNAGAFGVESTPGFSYIACEFFDGTANAINVLRKDLSGTNTFVPMLNPNTPSGSIFTYKYGIVSALSEDTKHVGLDYYLSTVHNVQIFSEKPSLIGITNTPNTGLCIGVNSVLFDDYQIKDADGDVVRIANFLNPINLGGITAEYLYTEFGISHFKIYGTILSAGTISSFDINATDGYVFNTLSSGTVPASSTVINPLLVQFTSPTLKFCDNETNLSLSQFVTYPNGNFSLNSLPVISGFADVPNLPLIGTIDYSIDISGCLYSITGNYVVVDAPIMTVSSLTPSCLNIGSISANVTGGTGVYSYLWNNGIQTWDLGLNVVPGNYTCMVTDGNNCKATGTALYVPLEYAIVNSGTQPPCPTSTNGTILLTVTNLGTTTDVTSQCTIVWNNGMSGPSLSGLSAGTYVASVITPTGCEVIYTVDLIAQQVSPTINFATVSQPTCGGSNGLISINVVPSGTYTYAWTNSASTSNAAASLPYGNYTVTISNAGCSYSKSMDLNEQGSLIIDATVTNSGCQNTDGRIDLTLTPSATAPTATVAQTFWSNGEFTPFLTGINAGTYSVIATSNFGCHSVKTMNVGTRPPLEQPICMVTVDTATTTNLVVWEKVETYGIDYYKIYREDLSAGIFGKIDTVQYSNLSVFNDVIAGADDRSWRYRVSAVNTCGVEGPISVAQKTIHLTTTYAGSTATLFWDQYEGFGLVGYKIFRYDGTNWTEIATTASSVITTTDNFSLAGISASVVDYFVAVNLASPCAPTLGKANDYNYTRSNKERGITNEGNGTGNSSNSLQPVTNNSFHLYPNPTHDELTLSLSDFAAENITYTIYDQTGKVVQQGVNTGVTTQISLKQLSQGFYYFEVATNPTLIKLIKN